MKKHSLNNWLSSKINKIHIYKSNSKIVKNQLVIDQNIMVQSKMNQEEKVLTELSQEVPRRTQDLLLTRKKRCKEDNSDKSSKTEFLSMKKILNNNKYKVLTHTNNNK